ncbi:nitrate/nitrite two-component system sensor histidine kinase [Idiomarina sp. OT37-5b]|jgi:two-component system nitrate/nitrite sensor histidine kinase NarX|uniref:Sensor protein n=1 Tax=Idiomarina aquatica TaxID=1327752 RepID=A0AA94EI30_9GAMM|nr:MULTISPECIES: ATP-binding protein [Idiomarina]AVJ54916.1 nitrate/nitrite two-component system sensor histidine kinase [Idiomarina sp. OT37-5b]RUO45553.1 nitrate/nitrite two-component system sensor histidine kinase [Idiomarina aquatica]
MRTTSIINLFRVSLALIVIVASGSALTGFLLLEKSEKDAAVINAAGMHRMLAFELLAADQASNTDEVERISGDINQRWQHPLLEFHTNDPASDASTIAVTARQHWQRIERQLSAAEPISYTSVKDYVEQLQSFVLALQHKSEQRMTLVRGALAVSAFIIVAVFFFLLYILRRRIDEPLNHVMSVCRRLIQGDFTARAHIESNDEIGQLSNALNKMSDTVSYFYGGLERRVEQQTAELSRKNKVLSFLYDTARSIIVHSYDYANYQDVIERLYEVGEVDDIELCLLTEEGSRPFLQLQPRPTSKEPCSSQSCATCIKAGAGASIIDDKMVYRFVLKREDQEYGVLIVRCEPGTQLEGWQQQLMSSTADQLALSQSLKTEEEQVRRLALMHERTVIARELHDSLAQALSYLKIQVTRLQKAVEKQDRAVIDDVSTELREGLNSAYKQLRELLTTFRLKVDGSGLYNALQTTVKQLSEQSDLAVQLDYRLNDIPLAPHEEIHLLQIIREASQNAVNHSQGEHLHITLTQPAGSDIELTISDDGIGIPENAEKLNHYGLAIMQERSRNLGGELEMRQREEGGTIVWFRFTPDYLLQ